MVATIVDISVVWGCCLSATQSRVLSPQKPCDPEAENIPSLPLYRKSLLNPALDAKDVDDFFLDFFFSPLCSFLFHFLKDHNYPDNLQVYTQTVQPNGLSLGTCVRGGISRNAEASRERFLVNEFRQQRPSGQSGWGLPSVLQLKSYSYWLPLAAVLFF